MKRVLGDLDQARAYLREVVPDSLSRELDWSTLERVEGELVDEVLSPRYTDLLFRGRLWDDREGWVLVLFEHQSASDRWMAWRLLRYIVRIWDRLLRDMAALEGLPVVLPVVLYTGRGPWTAPLELGHLMLWAGGFPPPDVAQYQPRLRYLVIRLDLTLDDEVQGLPLTRIALRLLKHAHQGDLWEIFLQQGDELRVVLESPDGLTNLKTILHYALEVGPDSVSFPEQRVVALVDSLGERAKEVYMSSAKKFYIDQGIEQGIEQGLLHDRARLVRLLERRLGGLSEAGRVRVMAGTQAQLDLWLERLLVATDEAAIFAEGAE